MGLIPRRKLLKIIFIYILCILICYLVIRRNNWIFKTEYNLYKARELSVQYVKNVEAAFYKREYEMNSELAMDTENETQKDIYLGTTFQEKQTDTSLQYNLSNTMKEIQELIASHIHGKDNTAISDNDSSKSPGVQDEITKSPGVSEKSSESPGVPEKITESPGVSDKITESPGVPEKIAESTGVPDKITESPGVPDTITESPGVQEKITESPGVPEKITESPGVPGKSEPINNTNSPDAKTPITGDEPVKSPVSESTGVSESDTKSGKNTSKSLDTKQKGSQNPGARGTETKSPSTRGNESPKPDIRDKNTQLSGAQKGLTAQLWFHLCISSFKALCNHPLFPKAPMNESIIRRLEVSHGGDEFAQRIFGYLHPPLTGFYSFFVASDDSSEVWLSNNTLPSHAQKICYVGERNDSLQYADPNEFDKFPSQKSKEIFLEKGKKYFIEVIHIQGNLDEHVEVAWILPGSKNLSIIDEHVTSVANETRASAACESHHYHHHHIKTAAQVHRPQYIDHDGLKGALSYCEYRPSYLTKPGPLPVRKVPVWQFLTSRRIPVYTYPDIVYKDVMNIRTFYRSTQLEEHEAREIVHRYMEHVENVYPRTYKLNNIINIEKKPDSSKGSRFLLELNVTLLKSNNQSAIISEYIYQNGTTKDLCSLENFQWKRKANIAIVIAVRNQGAWFNHFLDNLQEIYVRTGDKNISLVVFDFQSDDIDMEKELERRELPPYTLIQKLGVFSRTISLNSGIKAVKDPHTIVFLLDLHLEIPWTIFDDVRKHCFEGKSVYTPIIVRLRCECSPLNPSGYWEQQGFGIIAVYKSDWDRCGGLDEQKYKDKWGGEDWDLMEKIVIGGGLEYERLKHSRMFHFRHSRRRMWTGDKVIAGDIFSN